MAKGKLSCDIGGNRSTGVCSKNHGLHSGSQGLLFSLFLSLFFVYFLRVYLVMSRSRKCSKKIG